MTGTAVGERARVLHVLEAIEGGTSRHLVDVVTHAKGTEHIVAVPARRIGGATDETALPLLRASGADVRLLPMRRTPWSPANVVAVARVRRLIRSVHPDVVHGHSSIGGLLARLAATGTGRPAVYTPNGITPVRAGVLVERAMRRRTGVLVAVSPSEAELAVRLRIIGRPDVVVIRNGVELDPPLPPLDLRTHLGLTPGTTLVGTIARLVPQKAPEDFVSACQIVSETVPEVRFVMIGSGKLEADVDAAVARAGLRDRFYRIPTLPGAAGVLGQLDVFALSSRFEGAPYAPLEAMRAGTPVVLTAVVGSRDTVEDGVSGLIVPPGDPRALADAIAALLIDPDRRQRLGEAGRNRVAEHFDVRIMGASLDVLYDEIRRGRRA